MFRLLACEVPAAELHEVCRFDARWERQASIDLRDGDGLERRSGSRQATS